MTKGIKTIEIFDKEYFRIGQAYQLISKESKAFKNAILMNVEDNKLTFVITSHFNSSNCEKPDTLEFKISDFQTTDIKKLVPESDDTKTLDEATLIHYNELKSLVENKAIKVLKAYYKHKGWNFPSDFSLSDVFLSCDNVCVYYHAFDDTDNEYFPMKYFLTLDSKYLTE